MASIMQGAFVYVKNDDENDDSMPMVACRICKKQYKYHHSTSSLKYHLTNSHGIRNTTAGTRPSTSSASGSATSSTNTTPVRAGDRLVQRSLADYATLVTLPKAKEAQLTEAMAMWIAQDSRPVAICDDAGLQNVLRIATGCKEYTVPSRPTMNARIDQFFTSAKTDIEHGLATAKHVSLTCHYWTSIANDNYLGMTAHYIDPAEFKLISRVLDVSHSEERHTAVNVAEHIETLISSWGLDGRVTAVVTDNARNMVAAFRDLPFERLGCAAHSLQLSICAGLKKANVDGLLAKVRRIVGHVKHSGANFTELKLKQAAHGERQEALVSYN